MNESHQKWLAQQMLAWARSEWPGKFGPEHIYASFAGHMMAFADLTEDEMKELHDALFGRKP